MPTRDAPIQNHYTGKTFLGTNTIMKTIRIICEEANIDQEFLVEDIPALLKDLKNLT